MWTKRLRRGGNQQWAGGQRQGKRTRGLRSRKEEERTNKRERQLDSGV